MNTVNMIGFVFSDVKELEAHEGRREICFGLAATNEVLSEDGGDEVRLARFLVYLESSEEAIKNILEVIKDAPILSVVGRLGVPSLVNETLIVTPLIAYEVICIVAAAQRVYDVRKRVLEEYQQEKK